MIAISSKQNNKVWSSKQASAKQGIFYGKAQARSTHNISTAIRHLLVRVCLLISSVPTSSYQYAKLYSTISHQQKHNIGSLNTMARHCTVRARSRSLKMVASRCAQSGAVTRASVYCRSVAGWFRGGIVWINARYTTIGGASWDLLGLSNRGNFLRLVHGELGGNCV